MSNITPKKALGQHWLNDPASLRAIAAAADLTPSDTVLEIGPGQGALTEVMMEYGSEIHALEFDRSLIPLLNEKFMHVPSTRFSVEEGDIRSFDFNAMPNSYKVVGNIPYYLTANLIRRLTDTSIHKPNKAVLLLQKEVAERIAAQPGDMSQLSVWAQLFYECSLGTIVPAALFTPPPNVESQVIIMNLRPHPLHGNVDQKVFKQLVSAGFSNRRKTMLNSLSAGLQKDKESIKQLLSKADLIESVRPQELSLSQWIQLTKTINS